MKIKLSNEQIEYLSNQPEQGMGYQIVDIVLKDGKTLENRIVLNSMFLQLNEAEQLLLDDIQFVRLHQSK